MHKQRWVRGLSVDLYRCSYYCIKKKELQRDIATIYLSYKVDLCVQTFYSYLSHSINFITPADVTTQKCIYNNSHLDLISVSFTGNPKTCI
jgi:hypothetical protein